VSESRTFEVRITGNTGQAEAALAQVAKASQTANAAIAGSTAQGSAAIVAQGQAAQQAARSIDVSFRAAGASAASFAQANDNAARSSTNFGHMVGQAGFQVQDFAVQVASGQSALTAFAQQGSQLLGMFGAAGAVAGAALAIGTIVAQLLLGGDATRELNEAIERQGDLYQSTLDAGERYRQGLQAEAEALLNLRTAYASFSEARRRAEELRLIDRQADLEKQQAALRDRAMSGLGELPTMAANAAAIANRARLPGVQTDQITAQIQEGVRAVLEFRAAIGPLTADELATFSTRLQDAAAVASGPLQQAFLDAAKRARDLLPEADRLGQAVAQNALQQDALAASAGNTSTTLAGTRGQVVALADALLRLRSATAEDPLADLNAEAARAAQQMEALRRGGLDAYRTVTGEQERQAEITRRATSAQQAFIEELRKTGVSAEEAQRRGAEMGPAFVSGATRAVDATRAVTARVKELEDAARGAGRAAREAMLVIYEHADDARQTVFPVDATQPALDRMRGEAQREAERVLEQQRRQEEDARRERVAADRRVTDDIVRYGADAFADMLGKNSRSWAGFLDNLQSTARRVFARIAAEAIIRPIVEPIVSSLGLGSIGSALGLGGAAGGAASGGGMGLLGGLGTGFGLANMFSGGGALANAASWAFGTTGTAGAGGLAALEAAGGSTVGLGTPGAFGTYGTIGGLPAANVLGGGLGILGGAYGIYSGLQRGGVGGAVTAAGGLAGVGAGLGTLVSGGALGGAAGSLGFLAAAAPYLAPVAIAAAIAGSFLDGKKPGWSGYSVSLGAEDGKFIYDNVASKRYNPAQEIQQLQKEIAAMNAAMEQLGIGVISTGPGGVLLGSDGGNQSLNSQFAGYRFTSANDNIRRRIEDQSFASAEALTAAVAEVKQLEDTVANLAKEALPAFRQQLDAIDAQFAPLTEAARRLGFGLDEVTAAQEKAIAAATEQRDATAAATRQTLEARRLRMAGDAAGAGLIEFDLAARAELKQFQDQVKALGLTAGETAGLIGQLQSVQAQERAQKERELRGGSAAQQLLESLTFGNGSILSAEARGFAAIQALNTARQGLAGGGDVTEAIRVANAALPVIQDFLGPSERLAAITSEFAAALKAASPGADPAGLTRFLAAQSAGTDELANQIAATGYATVEELRGLRGAFADGFAQLTLRIDAMLRKVA
jgi:hypothetical protein